MTGLGQVEALIWRAPFEEALRLRDAGKHGEALELLLQILEADPDYHPAWLVTGGLYLKLGELEKAAVAFRWLTDQFPSQHIASLGLFHSLWAAGAYEEALLEIKRFLSLSPSTEYIIILTDTRVRRMADRLGVDLDTHCPAAN